jgi:hypothetical protein
MTTHLDEPTAFPTLFTCYKPIERHGQLLRRSAPEAHVSLEISPLDAFLMHQLIAFLPEPPQVVDLLADSTAGASSALWAAHGGVHRVIAPLDQDPRRDTLADPARVALAGHDFELEPLVPIVILAPAHLDKLRDIFSRFTDALVLVLPIGRLGRDGHLADLLDFCDEVGCHLTALRDLAPFFHASDLGLLWHGRQPHVNDALDRLRQMYEGNFQFLDMAHALIRAAERERDRDEDGEAAKASRSSRFSPRAYRQTIDRIRKAVAEVVPCDSTVIVTSRGDDELLNLGGRRAWHFPQTRDGVYAGHHPADSAAAIAHLEELRARGANILLLPVTSFWWLRHYAEFASYLEQNYRLLTRKEDACIIYALDGPGAGDLATSSLKRAWEQLRRRLARSSA